MQHISAQQIRQATRYGDLIVTLADFFGGEINVPMRQHITVRRPGKSDTTTLLMPAWLDDGPLGVKIVNIFPDNAHQNLPSVHGIYNLFDGRTGVPIATMDGTELTARRTAATAALATLWISAETASSLLIVGTGRVAREMIEAYAGVRDWKSIRVWGRSPAKAAALIRATEFRYSGIQYEVAEDLETAVRCSDVIATATLSRQPLILGEWVSPGAHVDLIGAYRRDMREADGELLRRANAIFADTVTGVIAEGGDILMAIEEGTLPAEPLTGDLHDIARGLAWDRNADDITVFKSVGAAVEDLAAAVLCARTLGVM